MNISTPRSCLRCTDCTHVENRDKSSYPKSWGYFPPPPPPSKIIHGWRGVTDVSGELNPMFPASAVQFRPVCSLPYMYLHLRSLHCCKPGHPVSVSYLDLQLWDRPIFNYKLSAISPLFRMVLLIFPFFKCNCSLGSKILPAGLDGGRYC